MGYRWGWKPYVSAGQRRVTALRYAARLAKQGKKLLPIEIAGRAIVTTFWGNAWCDNLESYSDFANRLPRGRTYVRNGSVLDLQIVRGCITAVVSGSDIYDVRVEISPLPKPAWQQITHDCARSIDSLIDLVQGRLSRGVMERLTCQEGGLFPKPKEISMSCSCPDWATVCKHVAAVLYGIGARLDHDPQMLFQLRDVDHFELIGQAVDGGNLNAALALDSNGSLSSSDLGEMFGIELETSEAPDSPRPRSTRARSKKRADSGTRSATAAAKPKPTRAAKQARVTKSANKQPTGKKSAATAISLTGPSTGRSGKQPAGKTSAIKQPAARAATTATKPKPAKAARKKSGTKRASPATAARAAKVKAKAKAKRQ